MTKFLFSIIIILASLTINLSATAETVEVSGGGECEGDITADNLNGKVVCTYGNGDRYEGQFVLKDIVPLWYTASHIGGKKQGQGTYTFANGGKYQGTFTNDAIAGEGVRTYANGDRCSSVVSNGQLQRQKLLPN